MKVCPVCDARAFDDAPICYGCLHRFEGDEPAVAERGAEPADAGAPENGATLHAQPHAGSLPGFLIRFTPVADEAGSVAWSCAVEAVAS